MNERKDMIFVDGSNVLIQLSKEIGVEFRADKPPATAIEIVQQIISPNAHWQGGPIILRKYWFASYRGNDEDLLKYSRCLRNNRFEPMLFKKQDGREKGVDIGLTKEMLVNAFHQNFDRALLIAGDEDYLGLVQEAKRYGQSIDGAFFNHGLSEKLVLALDDFQEFKVNWNDKLWKSQIEKLKNELQA